MAANPPLSRKTVPRLVEGSSASVLPLVLRFFGLFLEGVLRGIVAPLSKHRCRCASRVAPLAVRLKSGVLRLYETMTMRSIDARRSLQLRGYGSQTCAMGIYKLRRCRRAIDSQRWVRCAAFLLTTTPNSLVSGARAGKIVIAVGKTLASLVSYRSASSKLEKRQVTRHALSVGKSLDAYAHLALPR